MAKKRNSVHITSMSDLIGVVNHNCDLFDRQIKKLRRSNRDLKVLCVITIGCAIYTAIEFRKQEEQIYNLSVRVKKLENSEGE